MKRAAKKFTNIVFWVWKKSFPFWQALGFHITPDHFSQPIPDTRGLKDDLWSRNSELVGIEIDDKKQLDLLHLFASRYKNEYDTFPMSKTSKPHEYHLNNGMFESVDAEILYCVIRDQKPRKIYEIGAGYSTYLSAHAILKNEKEESTYQCELLSIDPDPCETIRAGFPGLTRLLTTKAQKVATSQFERLCANDILFIDSSHVLRIGGDVQYLYLEVLPRLRMGVIVHLHDIFLPAEYPKDWVLQDYRFWTEQYLLQAFLIFNSRFEVIWAGSYMHLKHSDQLERAFTSYDRTTTRPGSLWLRRTH